MWQQPCSGMQWVALAKQGPLDLPYNAIQSTQVKKLMEMLRPPPPRPEPQRGRVVTGLSWASAPITSENRSTSQRIAVCKVPDAAYHEVYTDRDQTACTCSHRRKRQKRTLPPPPRLTVGRRPLGRGGCVLGLAESAPTGR